MVNETKLSDIQLVAHEIELLFDRSELSVYDFGAAFGAALHCSGYCEGREDAYDEAEA